MREDLLITLFHPVLDERVKQLILDLKAAGHRVVCGTNAFERHYEYHVEHGEYAVFDRVHPSHLMGVAKPSAAFYEHVLQREGWSARGTFFIDDGEANVATAGAMGIRSFHYTSFPLLQRWLAENLR